MSNNGYKVEMINDKEVKTLMEPQISYYMHDPKNLHADVLVTAHQSCFDKVKAEYKDFDLPVQDYGTCKYPTLGKDGKIVLSSPTDFIKPK
jgi:hypothetical protein